MALTDVIVTAREIAGNLPTNIVSRYEPARYGYGYKYGSAVYTGPLLTDNAEYRAVQFAARHYSLRKPRDLSASWNPTGAYEYRLEDIVTGWNKDQYKVNEVIYPGNNYNVTYSVGVWDQNKIDVNDWSIYLNPADSKKPTLRFLNGYAPGSNSSLNAYLYYTAPHQVDLDNDTLSAENPLDFDPFCYLVASRLLSIASNYYANLSDPSVNISVIDNQQKSNMFMQRSKDAYKVFDEHINARISPTGRIDWDQSFEAGGSLFWLEPEYL